MGRVSLTDTVKKTSDGAILYDTDVLNQVSEGVFIPYGWVSVSSVGGVLNSAGRGHTLIVSDGTNDFVLRHYLRGGLPGTMIKEWFTRLLGAGPSNPGSNGVPDHCGTPL